MPVDPERIRSVNNLPARHNGAYVLHWAQMNRRAESNQALAYAVKLAGAHHLPMLAYEGLACSYPSANDRLHTFIIEGVHGREPTDCRPISGRTDRPPRAGVQFRGLEP